MDDRHRVSADHNPPAACNPVKALFWSAVINGVAAVPTMVMIMLMAVMGERHSVIISFWLTYHPAVLRVLPLPAAPPAPRQCAARAWCLSEREDVFVSVT